MILSQVWENHLQNPAKYAKMGMSHRNIPIFPYPSISGMTPSIFSAKIPYPAVGSLIST